MCNDQLETSTECGTRLFLEALFIFLRNSSCNLYVAWLHCSCITAHWPVEFPRTSLMKPWKQPSATLCINDDVMRHGLNKHRIQIHSLNYKKQPAYSNTNFAVLISVLSMPGSMLLLLTFQSNSGSKVLGKYSCTRANRAVILRSHFGSLQK